MTEEQLDLILAEHAAWLCGDGGKRANLSGANLAGAYLGGANLAGANLSGANLAEAYLARAYLGYANLAWADLAGAYLGGANLARADLSGANLARAYLAGANLAEADLAGANLGGARGCIRLDMVDPREYQPVAVATIDGWRIYSGCRVLWIDDALLHWGDNYKGSREIGDRYLRAINALPECPTLEAE